HMRWKRDWRSDVWSSDLFDTVVSTLSFCGYDDPLQMLALANQWCKPGGTILLMEHGISRNRLLSLLQNMINPVAKWIVGCHQNRSEERRVGRRGGSRDRT